MNNFQPIEKVVRSKTAMLEVHSLFYTIQGEGPFAGKPALFIRLAGCNLQCPLCDTAYTEGRFEASVSHLISQVSTSALRPKGLVVITGGEPFRQAKALGPLLSALATLRYVVQLETNGTLPPPLIDGGYTTQVTGRPRGVYIVCSPKTGKVNMDTVASACCFKYVGRANELSNADGLPLTALGHSANPFLARPPEWWDGPIYFQPADEQDDDINQQNMDAVVKSCLAHGYTLQLQIHKYLGME